MLYRKQVLISFQTRTKGIILLCYLGMATFYIALTWRIVAFTLGSRLKLTLFGSSHGELVGAILDGLPSGIVIDKDNMQKWLDLRRPAQSDITTQRKEQDVPEIVSGIVNGHTDGGPVTVIIRNTDTISDHYSDIKNSPRPGHADLTSFLKYGEFRNYSGGGFFSGRMTAPIVAAGSICADILLRNSIFVNAWISSIGNIRTDNVPGSPFDAYGFKTRMPDHDSDSKAHSFIRNLQSEGDSVGGIISVRIENIPPGIGEPFFDSVESVLSHAIFSIPAVKGIEFGGGFAMSSMKGSEVQDKIQFRNNRFITTSNHNGGILGGITNGMPITLKVAVKPTSSIRKEVETVDLHTHEPVTLKIRGRHDPCIAIRALPVVQTMVSYCLMDIIMSSGNPALTSRIFSSNSKDAS